MYVIIYKSDGAVSARVMELHAAVNTQRTEKMAEACTIEASKDGWALMLDEGTGYPAKYFVNGQEANMGRAGE